MIHKPKEAGPRHGFFEKEAFQAVVARLDRRPDPQVAVSIAYTFGWRMQSEVLTLERRQLDLETSTLRLDPGSTQNDEGRVAYLPPDLKRLLVAQVDRVKAFERKVDRIIPFLFPHLSGFRRTAVRNMVNAGVPERVAMTVTGHKTRAPLRRR